MDVSIFNLDPFDSLGNAPIFEEFDPHEYFNQFESMFEDVYVEAKFVTKQNIFVKMFSIIRKAFKTIFKVMGAIIKSIQLMIRGRVKTANQIIKECNVQKKHNYVDSKQDQNDSDFVNNAEENMILNFIEGISEDGILINPNKLLKNDPNKMPVKGKGIAAAGQRASQVVYLIINPKPIDEYIEFFTRLTDTNLESLTPDDVIKINNLCKSFSGRPSIASYIGDAIKAELPSNQKFIRISINQLIEFQRKVYDIDMLCEKVDNIFNKLNIDFPEDSEKSRKQIMEILNELSWASVNLQGGIHAIMNGMKGIYDIDMGYWGTISDPEILASFVEKALKYGMPGKYLVKNIYLICDKSIKGNGNPDKPLMGFGRLTLLPKGDIIYKIAINRYGIRSNKNDFAVMNAVRGTDIENMFADTTKTYNYIINVMEKVKAGSDNEPNEIEAARLGNKINEGLKKLGIGFSIYDIKKDAFGVKDERYVILDYGYLHRRNFEAQQ